VESDIVELEKMMGNVGGGDDGFPAKVTGNGLHDENKKLEYKKNFRDERNKVRCDMESLEVE
jgi:hypothetical protein